MTPTITDPSLFIALGKASVESAGNRPSELIPEATVQRKGWVVSMMPVWKFVRWEKPTRTVPS